MTSNLYATACRLLLFAGIVLTAIGCGGMGGPGASDDEPDPPEPVTAPVDGFTAQPAQVYVDGADADWRGRAARHNDTGDGTGVGLERLWVAHSEDRLFLRLTTGQMINLEAGNDLTLYLDADNDPSTGAAAPGAELTWTFGAREGQLGNREVGHADLGLASLPTVRADTFEVAIDRSALGDVAPLAPGDSLRLALTSDGDRLPDDGALGYVLSDASGTPLDSPGLDRPAAADLRLMSYNVPNNFDRGRNRLFDPDRHPEYRRIIRAVGPDVIGFQEMYDNSASEVEQAVEQDIDGVPESWTWHRLGNDLVLGTAYPVDDTATVAGAEGFPSGAFLLDAREALGRRLVVVLAHPKCCGGAEEDRLRQATADGIAAFLRDLKRGQGPFDVSDGTPVVVMGDMNFVGDPQQPQTVRTGQIVNTERFGNGTAPDWDGSPLRDVNPRHTGGPLHTTTFSPGGPGAFPPGRLDYAYVTDSVLDVPHAFVLSTPALSDTARQELGLETGDTTAGSDHLPLVIDVAR